MNLLPRRYPDNRFCGSGARLTRHFAAKAIFAHIAARRARKPVRGRFQGESTRIPVVSKVLRRCAKIECNKLQHLDCMIEHIIGKPTKLLILQLNVVFVR